MTSAGSQASAGQQQHCQEPLGGETDLYVPKLEVQAEHVHFLPILDLMDWVAMPLAWQSPWQQHMQQEAPRQPLRRAHAVAARALAPPESLLRVAARAACWTLNLTTLRRLSARCIGPGVDRHASLFATLRSLVGHILFVDEAAVLHIMQLRITLRETNVDESLELEGAGDVLDKDELEGAQRHAVAARAEEVLFSEYREELCAARRALVHGGKKASGNPKNKASPLYKWSGPAHCPAENPSQADARRLTPPGASIWRGNMGPGSWQVHPKPYPRRSVAWTMPGGPLVALRCVLQHAWRLWLKDNGLSASDCPIQGNFPEAVAVGAASKCS